MLADARAEVLVTSFAEGWLAVDDLEAVQPDMLLFPEFNEGLRRDFAAEMRLFLSSVLLEEHNVQTLLTADYTFVNERLARHYGIDGVVGPQFRRVVLDGSRAPRLARQGRGVAAHVVRRPHVAGAARRVGARQAHGHAADSAAARRRDELEHARGRAAEDGARAARAAPQGRELQRLPRRHRSVRAWRSRISRRSARGATYDKDADAAIDPRAELSGGRPVDGPVALRAALLERDDQFVQALTEKLMMYALGRELEYHDMPQVRAVVRAAQARGLPVLGARRGHRAERRVPHAGRASARQTVRRRLRSRARARPRVD